jgi:tetratricopeptide (TPR) repeat protein
MYAKMPKKKIGNALILLQIDVDVQKCKTPFIDLVGQGQFDNEREILFTMGAVFRIVSVKRNKDDIWIVQLKLTDEEDKDLEILTQHMRKDIRHSSSLRNLVTLMRLMGNHAKAEHFALVALQDPSISRNNRSYSGVLNDLGLIYFEMGQREKALEYYEKSLEFKQKESPEPDIFTAVTYSNLGNLFREQGDYETALSFLNKALEIETNFPDPDIREIAVRYNSIGMVYLAQKNYLGALEVYHKSLQLRLIVYPSNHPSLATIYNNLAQVYSAIKAYRKEVDLLKKSLEIQLNSLPPNHPNTGVTYSNLAIASTYLGECDIEDILDYWIKSYEILSINFPPDHWQVVQARDCLKVTEENVARVNS